MSDLKTEHLCYHILSTQTLLQFEQRVSQLQGQVDFYAALAAATSSRATDDADVLKRRKAEIDHLVEQNARLQAFLDAEAVIEHDGTS
jgi:hypothetical protein